MKFDRRKLLKMGGLAGLSLSYPLNALSNTSRLYKDNFFVLIQAEGGMDVTLGLDPKVHESNTDQKDIFIEYRDSDIIKEAGVSLAPSAHSLKAHAADIAIVNGIVMRRDTGHESLLDYISSGKGDRTAPYIPVEFSRHARPSPLGILANDSMLTGIRQPVISQLEGLLNGSDILTQAEFNFYANIYNQESYLKEIHNRFLGFERNKQEFFDSLDKIVADLSVEKDEIAVILSAFMTGNSSSAFLDLPSEGELDTHAEHEGVHMQSQAEVWSRVSDIFSIFKKVPYKDGSLFDKTTFMVVSEFSRTPYLNAAKGKDHNVFTNSVLLAGYGIKGGQVVGGSHVLNRASQPENRALHVGSPIDYNTGRVVMSNQGTGLIFPENVIKTLSGISSAGEGDFFPELAGISRIPGLIK